MGRGAYQFGQNSSIPRANLPVQWGMNPAHLSRLFSLLQQSPSGGEREMYRQWSALMLILILLGVIILTGLAFLVTRRRARRRNDALPKPKNAPNIDAWAEAGRRLDDSFISFDSDEPRGKKG